VEVTAVTDVDEVRAKAIAAELGAEVAGEPEELVARVDGVVVASPDATHSQLALLCIGMGTPALVEKPLANTAAAAREVVEAEQRAGQRLIQVGFMREYDPAHAALRRLVESGELGEPAFITGLHTNPKGAPRSLEEVVVQSLVHDLHSARFLTGRDIEEVFCRVVEDEAPGSVRGVTASLQLRGRCVGLLTMDSGSGYGYEVRAEVAGSAGAASLNDTALLTVLHDGQARRPLHQDWLTRFEEAYRLEAAAWIASLRAGVVSGPSAWDGYLAALAADACLRSAAQADRLRFGCYCPFPLHPERPEVVSQTSLERGGKAAL
jgi:myo-inositol 2-dehydrogenase/D-chiro-inositol 1-dehydrogenase